MQASTTPSASPAHEPDERSCTGCGAANGLTAAFCWQCYRPFASAPASTVGATGAGARPGLPNVPGRWMPGPTTSPLAAEPKSSELGTVVVVVVATLAVIGGIWLLFFRDGAVAMPEAFGGMPGIDTPETRLVVDTFRAELQTNGIDGDMVIYGNGTPSAALTWIRDASVPTTDAAFDEFASGFDQGIGASGSLGKKQTETVSGVTYVCAPVLGAAPGTICMWQDEDVFWLMFDFSGDPFGAGQDLALIAHDAAQAA